MSRAFGLGAGAPLEATQRVYDLCFACIGCQVFAPFFLLAGVLIRVEDGGPILFRQERLGRGRRPFQLFKLRTMRAGEVTRVGRWLRATGLDETAQFLNVLRGEMSMVGPRPLTAADVGELGWEGPSHEARWATKPGITGLAQVFAGPASARSLRLDALYARRRGPLLDTELIAWSFVLNLVGKQPTRRGLRRLRALRRRLRRARQQLIPARRPRGCDHRSRGALS